jgi:hypothetical protein
MTKEWDLLKYEKHTIVKDFFQSDVRCVIMRGPSSWCAYVGVPLTHPLAGLDYNDIPLRCHWGLTFGDKGTTHLPSDYYWYGWDYAHCDDASDYSPGEGKPWSLKEVEKEVWDVSYDFKKLVDLSEQLFLKGAKIIPTMKELNNA